MPGRSRGAAHTLAVVIVLAAMAGILAFLILGTRAPERLSPGVVHATEIKIAPEISGRLAKFSVAAGQSVRAGETLAELSNPELEAALVLADAQLAEARAARDRVYAGPRQEQVDALQRSIGMATANLTYAQQQYARTAKLAADGFASRQDLDKATAAVDTARADVAGAQEKYEAARLGPTREEREVADAKVASAAAAVAIVAARVAKLVIHAPAEGVVALLVAEPGEAIVPGQPVMTLHASGRLWVSFNRREDQLENLRIGAGAELTAAKDKTVKAAVTELVPLGEFAAWRAARAVGDHDLNAFLVRADPTSGDGDLQAGMSVWLDHR